MSIKGIIGGAGGGIDTSDATATANDILETKTAYVDGQKIEGVVPVTALLAHPTDMVINQSGLNRVVIKSTEIDNTTAIEQGGQMEIMTTYSKLADAINLEASNIKKDVNVLGVTGTLEVEGTDTSDATATADKIFLNETAYVKGEKITGTFDYDTCDELADNILGDLPIKEDTEIILNVTPRDDIYVSGTTLVIGG